MEAAIAGSGGSMADLGEWGIIAELAARMPAGRLTQVGIGDDAAVLATPSGSVVAAVDLLIENRHFRLDWSTAYDIGVKAAARSLADVTAMGAVNSALLVGLAAPSTLPARWATELADGLAAEAARAGAGVIGGDTARADTVTLSVTALGDLRGRPPVRRSGARPGDVVAVNDRLGCSAAGLALLTAGITGAVPDAEGVEGSAAIDYMIAAHRRPQPDYEAGPEAARLGATAMIDVSDGLLGDLGHVADESGVGIDIATRALPLGIGLREAASALNAARERSTASERGTGAADTSPDTALHWVLTGGEDHALAATFPPSTVLPSAWRVIGTVHQGSGVTVDGAPYAGPGGWEHFR